MARVLFTLSLLLLVVFTTARVFGAPTQNDEASKLNRQKRTFGFSILGGHDWEEFRRWPFVTMPPVKSMMSIFEEENSKEGLIRRIENLEQGHKRIIEYLKKLQVTGSVNQCRPSGTEAPAAKLPEPVTLVTPESTAVPTLDVRVQTDAPTQPTSQPTTTVDAATPEVKDKVEPSTTTKITTAGGEDKAVPPTSTKITPSEIEDKVTPPIPNKFTSAEVEGKVEPSTNKTTSSEIEDKVVPAAPSKFTSVEVEDKVEPSTTKTTTAEVDGKTESLIPTKIASTEVEDKSESTTPTKITSSEEEDKSDSLTPISTAAEVEPSTRPQEITSSEESTEKVTPGKTETSQVDTDVSATTTTAEAVADSNQETTTQLEDTNDIHNILI